MDGIIAKHVMKTLFLLDLTMMPMEIFQKNHQHILYIIIQNLVILTTIKRDISLQ